MGFLDSTSHAVQLLLALGGGVILFVLAFAGYSRALFIGIVVMIPFQPIDSKYGSINMAITYVVGFAMLLRRGDQKIGRRTGTPLIIPFVLLTMAYLIAWSLAPKMFFPKYMVNLIQLGSVVVLFYMSYAYFRNEKNLDTFFKALIISNVLVIIYSVIQVFVGYGHFSLFGISELGMIENRQDQRLVGPFRAVGITAEYLVIQSLLLVHYMIHAGRLRKAGLVILLCNLAILVGTGNRGGFIVAILAVVLFLYFYKRYIGGKGVLLAGLGFVVMLTASSFVMMAYTDFNVLYDRLFGTEIKGITPDTRSGWEDVVEKISERPVIGHGPRVVQPVEYDSPPGRWPEGHITYYPHSLYLYILYTTGVLGFLAYSAWAITYWKILCRERKRKRAFRKLGTGLSTLGMLIFVIFLIDQLKVEFLRSSLLDYQHYLAALFGMFVALRNIEVEDYFDDGSTPKTDRKPAIG